MPDSSGSAAITVAGLHESFGEQTAPAGIDLQVPSGTVFSLLGPNVLFFDEPTTGLDPRSRRTMWQVVHDLAAKGVTIFLTTQYLDEADELAGRIALLDHGKLVAEGTPDELKRLVDSGLPPTLCTGWR